MKCPLLVAAAITHKEKIEKSAVRCGERECAWWDDQDKRCVLATIAGCLKTHLGWVREMALAIPHERNYVK